MTSRPKTGWHRIGGWTFSPATGELRRHNEVRRLEPRAAKALESLAEARGQMVSHEQLVAAVWNGRALSDNSVAVVIGQLRKALDDDAREPRLIETIPKRGYRLLPGAATRAAASPRRGIMLAMVGALAALILAAVSLSYLESPPPLSVLLVDVANETANPSYDPLARATSELLVDGLGKKGFAVRRSGQGDLTLEAKLVMWDGAPFLGMTATDGKGQVRWSSMDKAAEGDVPRAVGARLDDLALRFPPDEGADRLANPASGR